MKNIAKNRISKRTLIINLYKFKPWIRKTIFSISKSVKFPYITQLKYCQKLDSEADPNNKFKPLLKKQVFSIQNQLNFRL